MSGQNNTTYNAKYYLTSYGGHSTIFQKSLISLYQHKTCNIKIFVVLGHFVYQNSFIYEVRRCTQENEQKIARPSIIIAIKCECLCFYDFTQKKLDLIVVFRHSKKYGWHNYLAKKTNKRGSIKSKVFMLQRKNHIR